MHEHILKSWQAVVVLQNLWKSNHRKCLDKMFNLPFKTNCFYMHWKLGWNLKWIPMGHMSPPWIKCTWWYQVDIRLAENFTSHRSSSGGKFLFGFPPVRTHGLASNPHASIARAASPSRVSTPRERMQFENREMNPFYIPQNWPVGGLGLGGRRPLSWARQHVSPWHAQG